MSCGVSDPFFFPQAEHRIQSHNADAPLRKCCSAILKKCSFKTTVTHTLTKIRGMKITPLLRYPPPLQLGITVTASLCITAAHCRQSTKFSNGPRISYSVEKVSLNKLVCSCNSCLSWIKSLNSDERTLLCREVYSVGAQYGDA
jgi:hypothetical protein